MNRRPPALLPPVPPRNATERLHHHVRRSLSHHPSHVVDLALKRADELFADGAGHMQTALDEAVSLADTITGASTQ